MPPDDLVHSIRLAAAWEAPGPTGRAAWVRRFGRPTGIGPEHRVFLVIAGPRLAAAVRVNGTLLRSPATTDGPWSYDVTPLLRHRNTLALEPGSGGGGDLSRDGSGRQALPIPFGEVRLDIVARPPQDASDGKSATMSPA